MRVLTTLFLLIAILCFVKAVPTKSKLQTGPTPTNDAEGRPYIEEVTVESVLQVLTPGKTSRYSRTNTQTSLQDGTKIEARRYN